jgi:hypothetical protein
MEERSRTRCRVFRSGCFGKADKKSRNHACVMLESMRFCGCPVRTLVGVCRPRRACLLPEAARFLTGVESRRHLCLLLVRDIDDSRSRNRKAKKHESAEIFAKDFSEKDSTLAGGAIGGLTNGSGSRGCPAQRTLDPASRCRAAVYTSCMPTLSIGLNTARAPSPGALRSRRCRSCRRVA